MVREDIKTRHSEAPEHALLRNKDRIVPREVHGCRSGDPRQDASGSGGVGRATAETKKMQSRIEVSLPEH